MNLKIAEEYLRVKHELPEGFEFYAWAYLPVCKDPFYVEFRGCVPNGVFKSGPRKGRPNFAKGTDDRTLNFQCSEYDQVEREWTKRTGQCPQCMGDGKELASAKATGESTYRDCGKCKGSGKAQS